MAQVIELSFPALGGEIPLDHGYALYGALSRVLPELHGEGFDAAVAPVHGQAAGDGRLRLDGRSRLRLRLPAERIAAVLPLAGKALELDGCRLRLGVPQVSALEPAASLQAWTVTIKNAVEPEAFLAAVRADLAEMGVRGEPGLPPVEAGPHAGKPRRRAVRIKDNLIVGFAVIVQGLSADESILLQERGLGGRRKMGCGWFAPLRPRHAEEHP